MKKYTVFFERPDDGNYGTSIVQASSPVAAANEAFKGEAEDFQWDLDECENAFSNQNRDFQLIVVIEGEIERSRLVLYGGK